MRFLPALWRAFVVLLWFVATVAGHAAASVTNPIPTLAELRGMLSNHVHATRFAASAWGVKIVSLDTGRTLFEHDSGKLLSPASNTKLFTVAAGLDRLGAGFRFRTSLYSAGRPGPDGTLAGDLVVYGRGDPGFRSDLHSNDLLRAFFPLARALTNAGVRRVDGHLIADESFLIGPPFGSGWSWDDLENGYGAPISALTVNANCATLIARPGDQAGSPVRLEIAPLASVLGVVNHATTAPARATNTFALVRAGGPAAIHAVGQLAVDGRPVTEELPVTDPARWFGDLVRLALHRHGVTVTGQVSVVNWLDRRLNPSATSHRVELAGVDSEPLSEIAAWILKPSQNLYTDLLLGYLGSLALATNTISATDTSEDAGVRELGRFLQGVGIPAGQVRFEEGSGLSRNNLVTAEATTRLLIHMDRHPAAAAWRAALPVAGVDGTLRRRFTGTAAEGNVRAKTGTLRWANSLSGYVTTAAGERLAFSILLNRHAGTERPTREEVDAIAIWLARFAGRSDGP